MSVCQRCGTVFHCAMADGKDDAPCWCLALPPVVAVPAPGAADGNGAACWCPDCLRLHIAQQQSAQQQ